MSVGSTDNLERDPLDDVLAAARWPEMPGEADTRLRVAWARITGRRRNTTWSLRVAAGVMVVVGAWAAVVMTKRPVPPAAGPIAAIATVEPPVLVPSRPANHAELAVAIAGRSRPVAPPRPIVAAVRPDPEKVVTQALAWVREKREADAVAAVRAAGEPAVDRLFARLAAPHVEERLNAARLLGRINGPRVTARLAAMVGENRGRREAIAALIQSDGPAAQAFLREVRTWHGLGGVIRSVEVQLRSF